MGLTQEQLYDLYDGSWEQQFVERFDKDIFGVRGLTPDKALGKLTSMGIDKKVDEIATKVVEMDNGSLGIRKDVLTLGLTERYVGLSNTLKEIGGDISKASDEYIKKMLKLTPRELMLLIYNTKSDSDKETQDFKLALYATEIHNRLLSSTEDKKDVEVLYLVKKAIESEDGGLEVFYSTVKNAIKKLELLEQYVYKERYYTPDNLNRVVVQDIQEDMRWRNINQFPIEEFVVLRPSETTINQLYSEYLTIIKPIARTKALDKLWEDTFVKTILEESPEQKATFDSDKYVYLNDTLVILRDGLTIVEPTGEFEHIPSSKVTKKVKEDVLTRLFNS